MSAHDVILKYLEEHESFTSNELAAQSGLKRNTIALAARQLFDAGQLHIKVRRRSGIVYQMPGEDEPILLDGKVIEPPPRRNTIFEDCRNSPRMQCVLIVYGRRPVNGSLYPGRREGISL